jgi:hypothetical protein
LFVVPINPDKRGSTVLRYGDDRPYSNVHVQSFNLESASGAAGSSNFVSLHFLTTVPPYNIILPFPACTSKYLSAS